MGHIEASMGVWFLEAQSWGESNADLTFLTDASGGGLAFWSLDLQITQVALIAESDLWYGNIFFNEALAVLSAIEWAANLPHWPHHILI